MLLRTKRQSPMTDMKTILHTHAMLITSFRCTRWNSRSFSVYRLALLVFFYFVAQSAAFADDQALPALPATEKPTLNFQDIIAMLDHTDKHFSYLGTKFVIDYSPARRSTTLVKVTYGGAAGLEKKEVAPLQRGQESQIILDDGNFLWHYIPSKASVVKKQRRLSLSEISDKIRHQHTLIEANYDIAIEMTTQVGAASDSAEIPSVFGDVMVAFQPKGKDRPSWKIWIEQGHGLVVRTEIYNMQGDLALLSAFSELTFTPEIAKQAFVMTVPEGTQMQTSIEKHFRTIEEAQKEVSFAIRLPNYMPAGFILTSIIYSPVKRGEKVQLAYIDGLSLISIFEERRAATPESSEQATKEVEIKQSVKGTFYDHGLLKILRWQLDAERMLTLVGEVADHELLKIAASITP